MLGAFGFMARLSKAAWFGPVAASDRERFMTFRLCHDHAI
jgi:hypothetical protein